MSWISLRWTRSGLKGSWANVCIEYRVLRRSVGLRIGQGWGKRQIDCESQHYGHRIKIQCLAEGLIPQHNESSRSFHFLSLSQIFSIFASFLYQISKIIITSPFMNNINTAFTRVENSLDRSGSISKDQKDLYESVLQKHYQIIQTFLQKINSLYIKNQEFQGSLNLIQERLDKIQNTNANIHYEFRTTHLMVDKRLNTIMADYANINEQIKFLRSDMPQTFLSTQNMLAKSALIKNRSAKQRPRLDSSRIMHPKIVINRTEAMEKKDHCTSKIESSLNIGERITFREPSRVSQTCKAVPLSPNIDSESQESSKPKVSCKQIEVSGPTVRSIDEEKFGVVYSMQWVQNQIAKQMDLVTAKMNSISQQWNQEKLQIKSQIFGPETEKYFAAIEAKMDEKLNKIKEAFSLQQERIKREIENVNETSLKNIGALEYKLSQKVESHFFEESMNNLSSAICIQLSNNEKYFSNKNETQRAIRFLENKINKIIEEEENLNASTVIKSSKDTNVEPYLRINKCSSQKKSEATTNQASNCKSGDNTNQGAHSLHCSTVDIDKYEMCSSFKDNKQACEPRKIVLNWKAVNNSKLQSFKILSQAKIRKTSIIRAAPAKNRSSHSNFVPEERVQEKQWRQKVVKILNTGDRKRVKVTFH